MEWERFDPAAAMKLVLGLLSERDFVGYMLVEGVAAIPDPIAARYN